MKLTLGGNGSHCIEEIKRDEIRFSNLAGRMTGSPYDDPAKPKHEIVVWIDDVDILQAFIDNHVKVSEKHEVQEDGTEVVRYSVRFKAYPKVKLNPTNGRNEQRPMVMLKNTTNAIRLKAESFGLVDSAVVKDMYIMFHLWQYDQRKPDCVACIDELWCFVDENAGFIDRSYLQEKFGYVEEDSVIEDEDVPFA